MDTAVRTFLFTDIEGSTQHWERRPEAMPRALAAHDAIMKRAVTGNGGHIFKTVGDAVCAEFARPIEGARAAIAAQQALHATDWVPLGLSRPLAVRMALQMGEAEAREGDYSGAVLNRIARLLRAGHGGQVLVCPRIASELDRGLLPGMRLRDLGAHRLRDVPGANHIYQLEIAGVPSSFPPLITLDPVAHNLPTALDACLARDSELAEIRQLLLDSPARLVTLLGPGGIGKTRLALHAAGQLVDSFADGVWLVDLSGVRVAELIPVVIASVLGTRIEPGSDPITAIASWAVDRRLLLILDNCEQIVEGVAQLVAALLPAAGGVRVLATSRIPLRIRGEQRIEIGPLPVELDHEAGPAVRLFLERARQLRPEFELTGDNQMAIFEICRQVDGIPLALELAAARLTAMSPDALRARLSSRLSLLTSSSRDLPERHQTLRAAIDWSYTLLNLNEQRAFRQLSIFPGGWSFAAAQAVAGWDELATADMLASLRDKSMVRVAETAEGEPRYSMLETIREYGYEQLLADAEFEATRKATTEFLARLSEEAAQYIAGGPRQQQWLAVVDREIGNFRMALQGALDAGDAGTAIDLAINLWFYWSMRGLMEEGQRWLSPALALAAEADQTLRARAFRTLGNLCVERGELPAAESLYRASLEIARSAGHELGIAQSLSFLGMVTGMQGRSAEEYAYQIDALERCRALGVDRGVASSLVNLAVWDLNQGRRREALERLEQVRQLYEKLQDEISLAFCQIYRARALRGEGRLEEAAFLLECAERVFIETGAEDGLQFARMHHAFVEMKRGNLALAGLLAGDAQVGYRIRGDRAMLADSLEIVAMVCACTGEAARGAEALGAAGFLRESTQAAANPQMANEIDCAHRDLKTALGSHRFAHHWEQGRQQEMRAHWLAVAPSGLLELIDTLTV